MNAGTCWVKNTIGLSGRSVKRPHDVILPYLFGAKAQFLRTLCQFDEGSSRILKC
jgi:hypothetical protein